MLQVKLWGCLAAMIVTCRMLLMGSMNRTTTRQLSHVLQKAEFAQPPATCRRFPCCRSVWRQPCHLRPAASTAPMDQPCQLPLHSCAAPMQASTAPSAAVRCQQTSLQHPTWASGQQACAQLCAFAAAVSAAAAWWTFPALLPSRCQLHSWTTALLRACLAAASSLVGCAP